jgi:hypothetical protein
VCVYGTKGAMDRKSLGITALHILDPSTRREWGISATLRVTDPVPIVQGAGLDGSGRTCHYRGSNPGPSSP